MSFYGHASYSAYAAALKFALSDVRTECAQYQASKEAILLNSKFGPTGPTGAQGLRGRVGLAGANGTKGTDGSPGVTGTRGATGNIGATGPKGQTGAAGSAGAEGERGFTGAIGSPGQNGSNASDGDTGPIGATGPAGSQGATGATGPANTDIVGLTPTYFASDIGTIGTVDSELRYSTTSGKWMSNSSSPKTFFLQAMQCNLNETLYTNLEDLLFKRTNTKTVGDNGVDYLYSLNSNSLSQNASFSDTTGLITFSESSVPLLVTFWVVVTNQAVTTPITFSIKLREISASGNIIAEASMVQTVSNQSIMISVSSLVQNVSVLAPTLSANGSFIEMLDTNEKYSCNCNLLVRSL